MDECAAVCRLRDHFAVHSAKISVHLTICRKARPRADFSRATHSAVNSMSTVRDALSLTDTLSVTPSFRPAHRGRLRRRARAARDAVPARVARNHASGGLGSLTALTTKGCPSVG